MKRFCLGSFGALAVAALTFGACSSKDESRAALSTVEPGGDAGDPSGLEASLVDPNADAATGPTADGACGGTTVRATARDANLLLVLDASGSMLQKPAGFVVNKWQALATSLRDALGPTRDRISLGLELFPNGTASGDACALAEGAAAVDVPIGPGSTTLDAIVSKVASVTPGGATPTAKALAAARDYFTSGAGAALAGDKYVILATDGGPNCNTALTCGAEECTTNIDGNCSSGGNCCDPDISRISCLDGEGVKAELAGLAAAGVKTFVVGIPGTEAYKPWLDQFAEAGGFVNDAGPDQYFSVSASGGVAGLTSVFSLITGELITSCRVNLDQGAPDPEQINVYVDDELVPQGGENGWEYDGATTPPSIVIKGATCEAVKSKGARAITVEYGCPTIR